MEALKFTLIAYGFTIIFAMIIAAFIPALVFVIKKLNLDRNDESSDMSMPSSDSMQEEEVIAVAIAVAYYERK